MSGGVRDVRVWTATDVTDGPGPSSALKFPGLTLGTTSAMRLPDISESVTRPQGSTLRWVTGEFCSRTDWGGGREGSEGRWGSREPGPRGPVLDRGFCVDVRTEVPIETPSSLT